MYTQKDQLEDDIQGNSFIFFLFRTTNIIMMLLGAMVVLAGIYLVIMIHSFTLLDLFLLCLGIVVVGIGYSSFKLRHSMMGLTFYLIGAIIYLIAQLIVSLIMASNPDSAVDYLAGQLSADGKKIYTEQIRTHIKTVQFIMLMMLLITVRNLLACIFGD